MVPKPVLFTNSIRFGFVFISHHVKVGTLWLKKYSSIAELKVENYNTFLVIFVIIVAKTVDFKMRKFRSMHSIQNYKNVLVPQYFIGGTTNTL